MEWDGDQCHDGDDGNDLLYYAEPFCVIGFLAS